MNQNLALIDFLFPLRTSAASLRLTRFFGIALGGSLFIALLAQASIPFYPVPITGQTLGVFLVGILLGRDKGTAAVLLYLGEGLAGLPVFANGAFGPSVFMGPTGGYLMGFVPAAFICGYLAERGWDRQYLSLAGLFVLANIAVYAPGLIQLGTILGWDKPILSFGLYPFLLGDSIKMLLITLSLPYLRRQIEKMKTKN